ncbi:phage tail tape measure protein [Mixta calida]|uniref:Phage tail tape measure protein n=1 Tax=Mixta calida TaxID=665913 RepID=A0ABN5HBA6_9GAMM|nr:phage tail tape measure protein [Mixta calida]AUY25483.1 phage tail tape measure protein [Mixta calida]ORM62037.1 phage tail tape measure protein [Mixta calida]
MAEQQSRLAIVIDSTGAQRNAEGLAGALNRMTQAGQKAADSAGRTAKATDQEARSLSDLLDKIDPVNAALNRLDHQQRQLAKFQAKGFIDTDTFSEYSKKIEETRNRLTGFSETVGKAGISSRQAAYQMRMIPAQMTDIAVSLAGGQSPFMVLLQQGGQLKDMFGGIGPAARAVGAYVGGLVNPLTAAAAATGALALAYYQGSEEQEQFYKTLVLTGNAAGKTSGQLMDMADQIARSTGSTRGMAASVLNQVASSGKVAGDSLEVVSTAVVNMSKVTGQSVDQLVSDFDKIAGSPLDSISKLNDQYHFLSLAVYNQIKALQDEGNQQEAARLATETYAATMNRRAKDIHDNLGFVETAWNSLGAAAKSAWDQMLNVGRESTLQEKLEAAKNAAQQQASGLGNGLWNTYGVNSASGTGAAAEVSILQNVINLQNDMTSAIAAGQAAQDKSIKTQQEADRVNQQYLTNADRRVKAIRQQNDFLKAGAITQEQYAKNIARINDIYKDPQQPKGHAYPEDAGARMLDQLRQQQQVLLSQYDTSDKIGTQQQALIKWEQQLADIKTKQTLTADQKSLLASADLITAQLQQNAALEKQIETREKLLALDKARADIERTITNRQSQYATDELFAGGGLSQYEQQQYTQRLSLEQSYNDKITQLRQQRASATSDIAREEIDQEIQLQQQALQTELSNYDAHIQRMNEARGSFTAGASRAWQEYQDSATNVSAMSEQLFTNAFTGMEDSLVSFVTTGKVSFSDFANSVLSDIARIAARQALVGLGTSIFSAAGGMFSGGAAASASSSSSNAFSSGAYNNLSLNAKGGVYDSPSLSAYSGGIYDSPKFFAFAKGAGVFGEAGPEAIMPLKRGPDGSLGVQLHSGGQASGGSVGDIIIQQTIHVSGNGDAALQKAMEEAARKGANDGAKRARQDMLQDFQNRGQARRLLGV